MSAPAPGVSPPAGERRTDRRAAKAVWILELPGRGGTIHLMNHCPGFAPVLPMPEGWKGQLLPTPVGVIRTQYRTRLQARLRRISHGGQSRFDFLVFVSFFCRQSSRQWDEKPGQALCRL